MIVSVIRATLATTLVAGTIGCTRGGDQFDEARARAHVQHLADVIGSRPTGSAANARGRQYVADELTAMGFSVRVQDTEAVNPVIGLTTRVANVIAVRDGARREAIGLVSHFDSVPEAAGALDDALGVAVCLEAARALVRDSLTHSLIVLVTDGEELGLMGARAAVADPEIAKRLRVVLNFDNTGGAGPSVLFETSPAARAPLQTWARAAISPVGSSLGTEIYRRLPNDTDFTVFRGAGMTGLNFAVIGDAYPYHTNRDASTRVATATLEHAGENTVAIVRGLEANVDAPAGPREDATYFDLARRVAIVYGPRTTAVIAWTACGLAIVAWLLLTRDLWRRGGFVTLLAASGWHGATAALAFLAMIGCTWLLRTVRNELNPWYARPQWFLLWLVAAGLFAGWLMYLIRRRRETAVVPRAASIWWTTLPLWLLLTIVLQSFAPLASYLVAMPLAAAGIGVLVARKWPVVMRVSSIVVLGIVALLWIDRLGQVVGFLFPLFGWLPIPPPVWLFPAAILLGALMLAPPLMTLLPSQTLAPKLAVGVTTLLLLCVAATGVAAYLSPAYTADRPARRIVRYIQDDVRGEAWWEIGSTEPTLEIDSSSLDGASWQRASDQVPAAVPFTSINSPFRFRTTSSRMVNAPPATARGSLARAADGRSLFEVVVSGSEPFAARLVLPYAVTPVSSSLAGRVTAGRWTATYVAATPEGFTARLTFDPLPPDALNGAVVVVTVTGLPGGQGRLRLPDWLPQERAAWQARSHFVLPVLGAR